MTRIPWYTDDYDNGAHSLTVDDNHGTRVTWPSTTYVVCGGRGDAEWRAALAERVGRGKSVRARPHASATLISRLKNANDTIKVNEYRDDNRPTGMKLKYAYAAVIRITSVNVNKLNKYRFIS